MTHSLSTVQSWRKEIGDDTFCVSTLTSMLDRDFINNAFATDDMYWAKKLPEEQVDTLISHSINLGLYHVETGASRPTTPTQPCSSSDSPQPTKRQPQEVLRQVGYARFATDFVTTAYLTDVYIDPDFRGRGLAPWLMSCCNEALTTLPALRNVTLVASPNGVAFYKRVLGMRDIKEEEGVTIMHRPQWKLEDVH